MEIIFCPKCGSKEEGNTFCSKCGAKLINDKKEKYKQPSKNEIKHDPKEGKDIGSDKWLKENFFTLKGCLPIFFGLLTGVFLVNLPAAMGVPPYIEVIVTVIVIVIVIFIIYSKPKK